MGGFSCGVKKIDLPLAHALQPAIRTVAVEKDPLVRPPSVSARADEDTFTPDAVMAWARRSSDAAVVHVSMLSRAQTGQACGCVCAGCGASLQAVNAGMAAEHFERPGAHRMSFRHQPGMQRSDCAVRASRAALIAAWIHSGVIGLPARAATARWAGASGRLHPGLAVKPAAEARILASRWLDAESAMLTLDSGRHVLVTLRADVTLDDGLHAVLIVDTNDPEVASMSLQEVLARARLLLRQECWARHWDDAALQTQAHHHAQSHAAANMDVLPDDGQFGDEPFAAPDFFQTLNPAQRGETLLHLHLKQLLARTELLDVPACSYPVQYTPHGGGRQLEGAARIPAMRLRLSNARLEQHLGDIVPDVMCDAKVDGDLLEAWPLLLEVAVTHRVGGEKLGRIQARGLACLELNAKRFVGDAALTVDQLAQVLQAPQAEVLYWIFHSHLKGLIERERQRLAEEHQKQLKRYAESKAYNERLAKTLLEQEQKERAQQVTLNQLSWRLRKLKPVDLLRRYVVELAAQPRHTIWGDRWHDVFAASLRRVDYGSFGDADFQPALIALHAVTAADKSSDQAGLNQVLALLESGLMDRSLQPYMTILLGVAKHRLQDRMSAEARGKLNAIRQEVWEDIQKASPKFTRPLKNDSALVRLYPELGEHLRPGQPGTMGFANQLRFQRALASGTSDLPRFSGTTMPIPVAREPAPPHIVEAALGPAKDRVWTIGGKVPFEKWSQYNEVAKLSPWHRHTIQQAYWAREQGQSVLDFVRTQQPRDELATRHCLEILASVYLLG